MKKLIFLLLMSLNFLGILCSRPKGDLTYCSYSRTGAAGLGKDYCELIADPDSVPKVVVVLNEGNRFDDPVIRESYPVDRQTVDSLARLLMERKVYKLNGYQVDEAICGGYSYRIYMEYSSGEKINARWYGHNISGEAIAAYNSIERFFEPWRTRAEKDARIRTVVERVTGMEATFNRVKTAVRKKKKYPELENDVKTLMDYQDSGKWKDDFEADERGELPKDLRRGVLSEDGLYNLLDSESLLRLIAK